MAARPSTAGGSHTDYVRLSDMQSPLAVGLAARDDRMTAPDMVSCVKAAELVGATRSTIRAWIAKGRCIGLSQPRHGFRLPAWQFEPGLWALVPELADALGTAEGWALLAFLEAPNGALQGLTPRVAIERGMAQRVLEVARQEGN